MNYIDFIMRIKNSNPRLNGDLKLPYSRMNMRIAQILIDNHYLKSAEKITIDKKNYLKVALGNKRIENVKFVSKPSRKIYIKSKDIKPVNHGFGLGIISTPKGIMTASQAKKDKIGGQYLFKILS
jgi:small subunit ribosomal protein S8